jgi:two-component system, NtrC family, sensor kinase
MTSYRNMKFASKLRLHLTITSSLALLTAVVIIITSNLFAYRQLLVNSLLTQAEVISIHSQAALQFDDIYAGEETLSAFSAVPGVASAELVLNNGEPFATYGTADSLSIAAAPVLEPGYRFQGKSLLLMQEITDNGECLGYLIVNYDLTGFYRQGSQMILLAILTGVMAILLAVLIANRLQKTLMRPVTQLAVAAASISHEADYTIRVDKVSNDELGELTDAFNTMLRQIQDRDEKLATSRDDLEEKVVQRTFELQSTQKDLMEAARQAGMAEVASDVLHNVGNVLNSVGIACAVALEKTQSSKIRNIEKTAQLLASHTDKIAEFMSNDPRGRKLPEYLSQLSRHLITEQQDVISVLKEIEKHVVHITTIISVQQSTSRGNSMLEQIGIEEIISDALQLSAPAFRSRGITLVKEYDTLEPSWVDRHKLLQIFANLLGNAKQALDESAVDNPQLTIRIARCDDGFIEISVTDNGIGIENENISCVFRHGFTTKSDGHGFGLHSSANMAQQMGGFLTAQSEGKGRGATFTLRIPLKQQAA